VLGDNAAEGGPIHKFASDNHGRDSCCIADVGCRIGVQQDYVASLPHLNGALQGFTSKKYCRIDRHNAAALSVWSKRLGLLEGLL